MKKEDKKASDDSEEVVLDYGVYGKVYQLNLLNDTAHLAYSGGTTFRD